MSNGGSIAPTLLAGPFVFEVFAPVLIRHAGTPLRERLLELLQCDLKTVRTAARHSAAVAHERHDVHAPRPIGFDWMDVACLLGDRADFDAVD